MLGTTTIVSCNFPLLSRNNRHNFSTLAQYPCQKNPNFLIAPIKSSKLLGTLQKGALQVCQGRKSSGELVFNLFDVAPKLNPAYLSAKLAKAVSSDETAGFDEAVGSIEVVSSDMALVQVLESEIKYSAAEDIPADFPFKIVDKLGERIITMSRQYEGETIEVEVYMHGDNELDEYGTESDGSEDVDEVPFAVRISKDIDRTTLEFACTATKSELNIKSVCVHNPQISKNTAYLDPNFRLLDDGLQKALHNYLHVRGFTPTVTNFLCEYMDNKDDKEYTLWLENLKSFVEQYRSEQSKFF